MNDDLSAVLDRAGRERLRGVLGLPTDQNEAVHPPRFPAAVPEPPLDESDVAHDEDRRDEWHGQSLAAEVAELSRSVAEVNQRLDAVLEQLERLSLRLFG
jgi:hypothetical protein